jgi:NAD(P)-dependent dehydrogenase (short-subunit alcohol dehydrogenase family)
VGELQIPQVQMPNFSLAGQTALVTGAGRGIGASLAHAFAGAGAQVAVAARTRDEIDRVSAEITEAGGEALSIEMDLRQVDSIQSVIDATITHFGKLDVLVNNAGLGSNHDAIDLRPSEWDELMAVNLRGLFFACQAAGRRMIERGSGRIINISSQAGQVGIVRHAAYCASKGGVEQLTRVLALEWGPHGLTVNAVAPTFIRTPGTAERLDDPDFLADVLRRIPAGRVGSPMDVAGSVVFLASSAAALVNGAVLTVDGGWTAQ